MKFLDGMLRESDLIPLTGQDSARLRGLIDDVKHYTPVVGARWISASSTIGL